MMLPPTTSWPPNFLTPRRRPIESRPLRELPPAFLCAISNYLLLLRSRLLGRGLLGSRFLLGSILRGLLSRRFLLGSGLRSRLLRRVLGLGSLGSGFRLGFRLRSLSGLRGLFGLR